MAENDKAEVQMKPDAGTRRQEQAQKDRELARERRLVHTAHRRKQQLAAEETAETERGQKLPEVHRR